MIGTESANLLLDELAPDAVFRADMVMERPASSTVAVAVTADSLIIVPADTAVSPQLMVPLAEISGITRQKYPLSEMGTFSIVAASETYDFQLQQDQMDPFQLALVPGSERPPDPELETDT